MKKHLLMIAVSACFATAGIAQAAPTPSMQLAQNHPNASSAQLSTAQRGAIVAQIVRAWGPFVQQVHQTSVGAWAGRMQGTFAAATDSNLQRAAGMKTFQGMMDALLGQHLTDAQVTDSLALQAEVLKSGGRPALLGSTTADLVYTPLVPCRLADTRVVGGPITGGGTRGFFGWVLSNYSSQGGSSTNCGVPNNPSALMLNFTVVNATASGWLTVFPFGTTKPLAANLNYAPGQIVGNEIAAKMTIGSATSDFSIYAQGTTDVVIDVVGYFMAPQATALDVIDTGSTDYQFVPGETDSVIKVCPTGYTIAGGGCDTGDSSGKTVIIGNYLINNGQDCAFTNNNTVTERVSVRAHCVRTPGR